MDELALLAAIKENPAEDMPRLALADWWEEHGDLNARRRADLIRVQFSLIHLRKLIAIAPSEFGDKKTLDKADKLKSRQQDLLKWIKWPSLPKEWGVVLSRANSLRLCGAIVDRGFIGELWCPAWDWLQHGDAIVAAHPVTTLCLTSLPPVHVPEFNAMRDWKVPLAWGGDVFDSLRAEWPSIKMWASPAADASLTQM